MSEIVNKKGPFTVRTWFETRLAAEKSQEIEILDGSELILRGYVENGEILADRSGGVGDYSADSYFDTGGAEPYAVRGLEALAVASELIGLDSRPFRREIARRARAYSDAIDGLGGLATLGGLAASGAPAEDLEDLEDLGFIGVFAPDRFEALYFMARGPNGSETGAEPSELDADAAREILVTGDLRPSLATEAADILGILDFETSEGRSVLVSEALAALALADYVRVFSADSGADLALVFVSPDAPSGDPAARVAAAVACLSAPIRPEIREALAGALVRGYLLAGDDRPHEASEYHEILETLAAEGSETARGNLEVIAAADAMGVSPADIAPEIRAEIAREALARRADESAPALSAAERPGPDPERAEALAALSDAELLSEAEAEAERAYREARSAAERYDAAREALARLRRRLS